MMQRAIKRAASDQARAAGCDERAARYSAHRAAYWRDWHILPEPRAIQYAVWDAQVHQHQRELGAAAAVQGG